MASPEDSLITEIHMFSYSEMQAYNKNYIQVWNNLVSPVLLSSLLITGCSPVYNGSMTSYSTSLPDNICFATINSKRSVYEHTTHAHVLPWPRPTSSLAAAASYSLPYQSARPPATPTVKPSALAVHPRPADFCQSHATVTADRSARLALTQQPIVYPWQ